MAEVETIDELLADLALINGKIVTVDSEETITEAVAVKDGRILKVGSSELIKKVIGRKTKIIDLEGKTVLPGLIDIHMHVWSAGTQMAYEVDVGDAESIDKIVDKVKERAAKTSKGNWIRATHYDDTIIMDKRHPTRWDLDKATINHPVWVHRLDCHMGVANSYALKLAGISRESQDPPGGKIDKDPMSGVPTGLLMERAQAFVKDLFPPYTVKQRKEGLKIAQQHLAEWGITTYTDPGIDRETFMAYQELAATNSMPIRACVLLNAGDREDREAILKTGLQTGFGNELLKVTGVKFMCDGSMSGRTAALLEPYEDEPENKGILTTTQEELIEKVREAHLGGLRPCIHAIGDWAIEVALDAIESALNECYIPDHRIRIEHCGLPTREQLKRIKELGVFPSSSIGFIYELGAAHKKGIGPERVRRYYPHKSYIKYEIISAGNSDWPVTKGDPMQQIFCAVTRKTNTGESVGPNQAISVMDAIRLYTINAAYANFEEEIKGSIELGKLADMVVLDQDVLSIPQEEIKNIKVLTTIVDGKIIFQNNE